MTRLLLAGATGLVGAAALKLSLADDRVTQVAAPTRRALPPHPKLLNPIVDSASIPYDARWWAADGAICALGTDIAGPILPAGARTSPASTVAAMLVEGALRGGPGRHVIGSAAIASAADGPG